MSLPSVTPMPLARLATPFDHPDYIFEPKLDGFRAVAYVESGACRLVSRNRNAFKTFEALAQAIAQDLSGQRHGAVLSRIRLRRSEAIRWRNGSSGFFPLQRPDVEFPLAFHPAGWTSANRPGV